jgi:hypothetical protein
MYLLWYRNNEAFVKANGKRKSFHKGSNSSNRFHLRQHYDIYKERCEKANIPLHHWAIPPNISKAKAAEAAALQCTKKGGQQSLDFKTMIGPREFTRTGTLHAVAKLIATNNQVSLCRDHANKHSLLRTVAFSLSHLRIMLPSATALSPWGQNQPTLTFQQDMM